MKASVNHSRSTSVAPPSGASEDIPHFPGLATLFYLPLPAFAFDRDTGHILLWNQALERLSGYTAQDVSTLNACLEILFRDYYDPRSELPLLFSNLAPGSDIRCRVGLRSHAGDRLDLEAMFWDSPSHKDSPVIPANGSELFPERCRIVQFGAPLVANQTPQPARQTATSPLAQTQAISLERYQLWLDLALESLNKGMWTIHFPPGQTHYHSLAFTSPHTLEMLGYSPKEIADSPSTWDKLVHPDDWPEALRRMQEHVLEAKTDHYEVEFRVKAKDGSWRWLLSYGRVVRRDAQARPLEAIGTHIDIDRIKQADEHLQNNEFSFRTLVENMPLGIMLVDKSGDVDYINPKFCSIFSYAKNSIHTLDAWLKLAYPDQAKRAEAAVFSLSQEENSYLSSITCGNGDNKYIRTHLTTLPSERRLLAYEDVTAQINSEQALLNREQELRENSQTLEDINTALRVVLNQKNSAQSELKSTLYINLRDLILPHLDALEATLKTSEQDACLDTVRDGLKHMLELCHTELTLKDINLTGRERQLADLIRSDMTSRRIAAKLGLSESVVEFHRTNIRKKLGIAKKKVNLKTYLKAMP